MRSNEEKLLISASIFLLIITIYGLFTHGFGILLYTLIAVLVLLYTEKYLSKKKLDVLLQESRISWFFGRISDLDHKITSNIHYIQQFVPESEEISRQGLQSEMSLTQFRLRSKRELPDISQAEIEMTKIEERSSIILGTLVFIPVLFALIHIFREVTLAEFLIELFVAINLGILVLETQGERYSLKDWDGAYNYLFENRDEIITNPRALVAEKPFKDTKFHSQELGITPNYNNTLPATSFVNLVLLFLIELTSDQRSTYLDNILEAIDELPGKQVVMEQKWATYTTRLLMIAISSTALGALFASLAVLQIPLLSTPGFEFETTTNLIWGQYILLITLSSLVLRKWFSPLKTARWIGILTFVYIVFYWINQIII